MWPRIRWIVRLQAALAVAGALCLLLTLAGRPAGGQCENEATGLAAVLFEVSFVLAGAAVLGGLVGLVLLVARGIVAPAGLTAPWLPKAAAVVLTGSLLAFVTLVVLGALCLSTDPFP